MSEPPIAFIHIPRTGGHSLREAMTAELGPRVSFVKVIGPPSAEDAAAIPPGAAIIAGHMWWGLHRHMSVRYATVLRDPIERTISQYALFLRQKMRTAEGRTAEFCVDRWPMEEFLSRFTIADVQTTIVAGTDC